MHFGKLIILLIPHLKYLIICIIGFVTAATAVFIALSIGFVTELTDFFIDLSIAAEIGSFFFFLP